MISYFINKKSTAKDLNREQFMHLINQASIEKIIDEIADCQDKDRIAELKGQLPAVTWQSHFPHGSRRSASMAEPSGLFMIDVDHVVDARALWSQISTSHPDLIGTEILLAHITPSGHGLRLVMVCKEEGLSIEERQKLCHSKMELPEIDAVCKDFSRLSFLVPRKYILYFSENLFSEEYLDKFKNNIKNPNYEKPVDSDSMDCADNCNAGNREPDLFRNQPTAGSDNSSNNNAAGSQENKTDGELLYNGKIPYKTIVDELIDMNGGQPAEGVRNNTLYRLARKLRYIVDFNAWKLKKILPSFGLPDDEVIYVAQSACKSARSEKIPYDLYKIIQRYEESPSPSDDDENDVEEKTAIALPPLPPIFKQFVSIAPDDFKVPSIFALLPVIGTLCSRLRAEYLDGEEHAPNFTTVIEAPQASGKSFTRRIVKMCMAQVEYMDSVSRIREQQYMMQLKKARNSKNQPEEPVAIVRSIPASVSIAKLLKRLANAKGLHLFSFLEELDTLTKSNKAGAWSQKTDIYRNAFDNADYGQEYMSENSYSGIFPVFYNLLLCGTPAAVSRFYKDPEDGLVSRIIFCNLPSQFGAQLPRFRKFSRFEKKLIEDTCCMLNENLCCNNEQEVVPEHNIDMSFIFKFINKWLEKNRLESVKNASLAQNIFYRRSAVIGFRAAMVATYLWRNSKAKLSEKELKKNAEKFFQYVAEYVLNSLLRKFADDVNKMTTETKQETKRIKVYEEIDDNFTIGDLIAKLKKNMIFSKPRQIIYLWKKEGLIEKTGKDSYKKIKK